MMRIIVSFLFLATAVTLFFIKTQPYLNDIKTLQAQKQEYGDALASSRELQTLRDKLLSQYNAISQDDRDRLNKLLPSQMDSSNIIVMFEEIVKAHGILLKKIDVKESKQSANSSVVLGGASLPYKTINLTLLVSGPYASILALFSDLDKSLRLVDVENVSFSAAATDTYEFNITTKMYSVSTADASLAAVNVGENENTRDILSMLAKLKKIEIDLDFFNNEIFKSLVDFTRALELPKEYGRTNPFAPF
jgi:hypothetical protein